MTIHRLLKKILKVFVFILETYIPFGCPICGNRPIDNRKNMFCKECFEKLPFIPCPACKLCGGELDGITDVCTECARHMNLRPWKEARAVLRMNGFQRDIFHSFKYRHRPELARCLGYLAVDKIEDWKEKVDMIVPVPLHWTRYFTRGYNQAEFLAEIVGDALGICVIKALKRSKRTSQQAKRKGAKARILNMKGAFQVKNQNIVKNHAILLIDDILTTGATLSSAAQCLLEAGAGEIYVLIIARR